MLSIPAKLITPVSKASSERSKLTIQSFRMKKRVKWKGNWASTETLKIIPSSFRKFRWESNFDYERVTWYCTIYEDFLGRTAEVCKTFSPRNSIPSNDYTILLIICSKVGIIIRWHSIWWKIRHWHTYPSKQTSS